MGIPVTILGIAIALWTFGDRPLADAPERVVILYDRTRTVIHDLRAPLSTPARYAVGGRSASRMRRASSFRLRQGCSESRESLTGIGQNVTFEKSSDSTSKTRLNRAR